MVRLTPARRLRRAAPAALLAAILLSGSLPSALVAGVPGVPDAAGRSSSPTAPTLAASLAGDAPSGLTADASRPSTDGDGSAAFIPAAGPLGPDPADPGSESSSTPAAQAPAGAVQPSEAYVEWLAHEHDRIDFTPGGRVTVGFSPRTTDRWAVGGVTPTALPAGRATGAAMASVRQGSTWAEGGTPAPGASPTNPGTGARAPQAGSAPTVGPSTPGSAPFDAPSNIAPLAATPLAAVVPTQDASVTPDAAAGLRRQVFGFLPYWELSGASTSLNYPTLSTIAYFSVGADAAGNLLKRNRDGSVTTGWAGWTSSSMTSVINAAHSHGTRVVLTASVFAWTSTSAATQRALLGSATARGNFARQLVAAVRDRGADGVNLDFEPLVTGQEANFVALLKTLRADLNAIRKGYQITFDTTGYIGNYPLEASLGSSAADAVFIMGYDYRTGSATTSGSIDPLSGPTYDLADTVRQYVARVSPSRVILGVPWYGRAWSTSSSAPRATNISSAKYGYSAAVNYENIPALVAKYGRKWDAAEQSPYIVYRRQNCTSTYGCVTSWRQVWFDDPASLALRYALVNDYGLRGAGMWALGYQGGYQDMAKALSNAFLVDHSAPEAGIRMLPAKNPDEGIVVSWSAADVSAVASYDVQVAVDGGAWSGWLTGVTRTSDVWLGADGHAYAFRVRATDAKGNTGAWNVTAVAGAAPSSLAVGRFGRVTLDGLAYRAGPDTSAARLGSLPAGTIVALTSGPVSADGYTWYEVTQPVREWAPVSFVERGVWVAVRSSTATNVVPFHAPNATVVDAGITRLDFGGGGLTGTALAAVTGRTFSPNGDTSRDTLTVRWTATVAFGSLTLNVLRTDGSLVGSVAVPSRTTGTHTFAWDGTVGGKRVPDGRYVLQLAGVAGSRLYRAPSAVPTTAAQIARYGVVVDTVAPVVASSSASAKVISPNADGRSDTVTYALRASGATTWSATVAAGSAAPVRTVRGAGGTIAFTWNGKGDAGALVPDGAYTVTLAACDAAGNCARRAYPLRVDTRPPTVTAAASPASFSPNGDGTADRTALRWTASEASSGSVALWHGTTLVRRWAVAAAIAGSIAWDGRTTSGAAVADGRYTVRVDVRDGAGNRRVATATVTVDRTAGALRWSRNFFPQDGDALAPTAAIGWRQTRTAAVTLAIYDASGALVRTVWTNRSLAAGGHSWTWNGKRANGTWAPQGQYTARLTVASPFGTQVLRRSVWAAAFPTTLSASTVRPGQTLTVRFGSTEALRTAPRVTFVQPGRAGVTVTATRLADGTYRAAFPVRAGASGSASVRIAGTDIAGHGNATLRIVAMAL